MRRRWIHNLLQCTIAAALFVCTEWAFSADLVGTARDAGQIMSNREVILSSQPPGNLLQTTQTTGAGQFAFPNIPPGEYELECPKKNNNTSRVKVEVRAGINRLDCQ